MTELSALNLEKVVFSKLDRSDVADFGLVPLDVSAAA